MKSQILGDQCGDTVDSTGVVRQQLPQSGVAPVRLGVHVYLLGVTSSGHWRYAGSKLLGASCVHRSQAISVSVVEGWKGKPRLHPSHLTPLQLCPQFENRFFSHS